MFSFSLSPSFIFVRSIVLRKLAISFLPLFSLCNWSTSTNRFIMYRIRLLSLSLSLTLSFSFTLFFTRSFFCPISFSLALSYSLFLVLSFSVALFCIERQLLHLIQDIPLAWNALVPAFHCYLWYGSHTATMNPRCIRKAFEFRSMFSNHLLHQIIQICSCNWKIEYLHRLILARHQPFSHFKWRCIHFISFCFEKNRENTTNFCSASRYEQQQQQKREEKKGKSQTSWC